MQQLLSRSPIQQNHIHWREQLKSITKWMFNWILVVRGQERFNTLLADSSSNQMISIGSFLSLQNSKSSRQREITTFPTRFGDSGYAGEPDKIVVSRPQHPKDFKKFLGQVKSRQETFNARLKVFRVLTSRFHHGTSSANKMKMHQMCVEMIAVMVQYSMENGAPLFES